MSKFYRTVIEIEVLSHDPLPDDLSLTDLAWEIGDGEYSATMDTISADAIDGPTMAAALQGQGSDPAFLGLTEDGQEVEE